MKFRIPICLLIAILIFIPVHTIPQTTGDPADALPKTIEGWKTSADRFFNNETLYNYIDGGAELFLSFGFSKVFNRVYSNDKGNEVIVDIFYMNKPEDAYGAFLFTSGRVDSKYGEQSQVSQDAVIFRKMNYYISITCNGEGTEVYKLIERLASLLDNSITGKAELPKVIRYLPEENLDKESIRYFRHYIWLNTHLFLSNDDILNINQNTEAVTAKYGTGENKAVLTILEYPDEQTAKTAFTKFNNQFYKGYASSDENKNAGLISSALIFKKIVVLAFSNKDGEDPGALLSSAMNMIAIYDKK